jgi:hypothetical protein
MGDISKGMAHTLVRQKKIYKKEKKIAVAFSIVLTIFSEKIKSCKISLNSLENLLQTAYTRNDFY